MHFHRLPASCMTPSCPRRWRHPPTITNHRSCNLPKHRQECLCHTALALVPRIGMGRGNVAQTLFCLCCRCSGRVWHSRSSGSAVATEPRTSNAHERVHASRIPEVRDDLFLGHSASTADPTNLACDPGKLGSDPGKSGFDLSGYSSSGPQIDPRSISASGKGSARTMSSPVKVAAYFQLSPSSVSTSSMRPIGSTSHIHATPCSA